MLLCPHAIASIMSCHVELMVDCHCIIPTMLLRVPLRVVVEVIKVLMHVLLLTIIILLHTHIACSVWPLFLHISIDCDFEFRRVNSTALDI